jgi:hypothetical protein
MAGRTGGIIVDCAEDVFETWWVMRAPTGHQFCVVPAG